MQKEEAINRFLTYKSDIFALTRPLSNSEYDTEEWVKNQEAFLLIFNYLETVKWGDKK